MGVEEALLAKGYANAHPESTSSLKCNSSSEKIYKTKLRIIPESNFKRADNGKLTVWKYNSYELKWENFGIENSCYERLITKDHKISTFLLTCGSRVKEECKRKLCIPICCGTNDVLHYHKGDDDDFRCRKPLRKHSIKNLSVSIKKYGKNESIPMNEVSFFYLKYNLKESCNIDEQNPFTYKEVDNLQFVASQNGFRMKLLGEYLHYSEFCIARYEGFLDENETEYHRSLKIRRCKNREWQKNLHGKIGPILSGVSILFLLIALIYVWIKDRNKIQGAIKICFLLSSIIFSCLNATKSAHRKLIAFWPKLCTTIGFARQFTYLLVMCWISVLSYDVWLTFRKIRAPKNILIKRNVAGFKHKRFKGYFLFATSFPSIVVIFTGLMNFCFPNTSFYVVRPDIGEKNCGPSGGLKMILYFHVPAAVILLISLAFFLMFTYNFHFGIWTQEKTTTAITSDLKEKTKICVALFILTGGLWTVDFATAFLQLSYETADSKYLLASSILDWITYLNGFFVCLAIIINSKAFKKIQKFSTC